MWIEGCFGKSGGNLVYNEIFHYEKKFDLLHRLLFLFQVQVINPK